MFDGTTVAVTMQAPTPTTVLLGMDFADYANHILAFMVRYRFD